MNVGRVLVVAGLMVLLFVCALLVIFEQWEAERRAYYESIGEPL